MKKTKYEHTASIVARWFLNYNKLKTSEEGAELISNLKLQKLLYYAQGCFLAFYDRPLFKDEIEAWAHGPVVPSVYREFKKNGSAGISEWKTIPSQIKFSEEEEDVLEKVYDYFGQFSAWKLRNMTHEETPWQETKKNDTIAIQLIEDYFKETYVEE